MKHTNCLNTKSNGRLFCMHMERYEVVPIDFKTRYAKIQLHVQVRTVTIPGLLLGSMSNVSCKK